MKISVIGKISVGKSSFINAFYSVFTQEWCPIATISFQRETFQPTTYVFGQESGEIFYEKRAQENKEKRENSPEEFEPETYYVKADIDVEITDFPGFNDKNDKRDCKNYILENMGDITIFATNVETAFTNKEESEFFAEVQEKSRQLNKNGIYNKVILVVNKYDYVDDEMEEVFQKINFELKFRFCCYSVFKNLKFSESKKAKASDAPFDPNNLVEFLQNEIKKIKESKRKTLSLFYRILLNTTKLSKIIQKYSGEFFEDFAELKFEIMKNILFFKEIIIVPDYIFCEGTLKDWYSENELFYFENDKKVSFRGGDYVSGNYDVYPKFKKILVNFFENNLIRDFRFFRLFLYVSPDFQPKNKKLKIILSLEEEGWKIIEAYRCDKESYFSFSIPKKILGFIDVEKLLKDCYLNPGKIIRFVKYL